LLYGLEGVGDAAAPEFIPELVDLGFEGWVKHLCSPFWIVSLQFFLFVVFMLPFSLRPSRSLRCAFSKFTAKGAKTAKIVPDWYVMLTPNFLPPGYLR